MPNFAFTSPNLTFLQLTKIDQRFKRFMTGWKVVEIYKGNTVIIPDYVPFNYFEVTDKPDGIENEKQLSIWCGWAGRTNRVDIDGLYDAEVIINLRISGQDVLGTGDSVTAEILKSGGAPMQVYWNDKL